MAQIAMAASTRRLTTILASDVVGYSRLMATDEEATLATLRTYRGVISELVAKHGGRVFNTAGDAVLAEFGSAVEAVRCAVSIQEELAVRNGLMPEESQMWLRIGINVGDVIAEDGDIFGDGVNVAARLEGLAEKGGICISGGTYEQVKNKLSIVFTDIGPQSVKNIPEPIRAFRALPGKVSALTADATDVEDNLPEPAEAASALPLPNKPSIAVLPFDNLSGDPEQEYFADGLAEDIITGLSRFQWFFVIARNSSFTYKGRATDVKQIARELGVQYVLEGSVRKVGNRVRITAQLIDALTGRHVWAERYDRDIEDIFAVQDEVTEAIVGAVAPSFVSAEARRVERKPPDNFDAWDCIMRGNWFLSQGRREDNAEAQRLFERALEIDPGSTAALTGLTLALCHSIYVGWADDPDEDRAAALAAGQRAVTLNPKDAEAYFALANGCFAVQQLDAAAAACRQALELNPNLAIAEGRLAHMLGLQGEYEQAIVHAEKAYRLSPLDPFYSWWGPAKMVAAFGAGDYEEAAESARKLIRLKPEFPSAWRFLAASLAQLDRLEEARAATDRLLQLMPHESLRQNRSRLSFTNADFLERYIDDLRKAGVPE